MDFSFISNETVNKLYIETFYSSPNPLFTFLCNMVSPSWQGDWHYCSSLFIKHQFVSLMFGPIVKGKFSSECWLPALVKCINPARLVTTHTAIIQGDQFQTTMLPLHGTSCFYARTRVTCSDFLPTHLTNNKMQLGARIRSQLITRGDEFCGNQFDSRAPMQPFLSTSDWTNSHPSHLYQKPQEQKAWLELRYVCGFADLFLTWHLCLVLQCHGVAYCYKAALLNHI